MSGSGSSRAASSDRHLVVVGGGISGLAAAWEAVRRPGWRVTVLEADDRLGGKLRTSPFAGRLVDEGADAFLRRVPDAIELCAEVGVDDLISPTIGNAKLWVDDALRPLPSGTVLGVPLDLEPLRDSGTVSAASVALAEAEGLLGGSGVEGDVSLGLYLRQHFGDEIVDRLVEPLVGGIYAGVVDDMSLDATTPQLAAAAHASPSLRAGLDAARQPPTGDPVFSSPADGMSSLVERLADAIRDAGGELRTGPDGAAIAIQPGARRQNMVWAHGREVDADAVVVAVPPVAAARLLDGASPRAAALVAEIGTASVVLVTLAFRLDDIPMPLDASGFLVPRTSPGVRITAASWTTSKWSQLARDDELAILRVSLGHADDPGAIELDDAAVLDTVARDLEATMGITEAPIETRISRWRDGFPQYGVGHLDRIDTIERQLAVDLPGVAIAGAMCRGVGIPACIRQGRAAARAAMAQPARARR